MSAEPAVTSANGHTFVTLHDDPDAGPDAFVDELCGISATKFTAAETGM